MRLAHAVFEDDELVAMHFREFNEAFQNDTMFGQGRRSRGGLRRRCRYGPYLQMFSGFPLGLPSAEAMLTTSAPEV